MVRKHWRPARSGLRVGGNRVSGAQAPEPDDPGGDSRTRGMAVGGAPFGGFPATEPGLSAGSRCPVSNIVGQRDKSTCSRAGRARIMLSRPRMRTRLNQNDVTNLVNVEDAGRVRDAVIAIYSARYPGADFSPLAQRVYAPGR